MNHEGNGVCHVAFHELADLLTDILHKAGLSWEKVLVLADNCARCERDGSYSHGILTSVFGTNPIAFAAPVADLLDHLRAAGQSRLPGERRLRHRHSAELDGIPIAQRDWETLSALVEVDEK